MLPANQRRVCNCKNSITRVGRLVVFLFIYLHRFFLNCIHSGLFLFRISRSAGNEHGKFNCTEQQLFLRVSRSSPYESRVASTFTWTPQVTLRMRKPSGIFCANFIEPRHCAIESRQFFGSTESSIIVSFTSMPVGRAAINAHQEFGGAPISDYERITRCWSRALISRTTSTDKPRRVEL